MEIKRKPKPPVDVDRYGDDPRSMLELVADLYEELLEQQLQASRQAELRSELDWTAQLMWEFGRCTGPMNGLSLPDFLETAIRENPALWERITSHYMTMEDLKRQMRMAETPEQLINMVL